MNLRLVKGDGNPKLTFLNVVYRETIGRFLSWFLAGVGYIMAGIDREKRGLHDMLCDTRVVYEKNIRVNLIYPRMVQPIYNAPAPGTPTSAPGRPSPGAPSPGAPVPGREERPRQNHPPQMEGMPVPNAAPHPVKPEPSRENVSSNVQGREKESENETTGF